MTCDTQSLSVCYVSLKSWHLDSTPRQKWKHSAELDCALTQQCRCTLSAVHSASSRAFQSPGYSATHCITTSTCQRWTRFRTPASNITTEASIVHRLSQLRPLPMF